MSRRKSAVPFVGLTLGLLLIAPSSAFAGTLTSTTFTAAPGYTSTGAVNTQYDWGFTTATSSTLSRVSFSVPPGTSMGNRYLALSGTYGNYASTPDTPANSMVTGDLDVRVKVAVPAVVPAGWQTLVGKWDEPSNHGYQFSLTDSGYLQLDWSSNGTDDIYLASTVHPPIVSNSPIWLRGTLVRNNGSGSSESRFYTSSDGVSWTQLGATRTRPVAGANFDSTGTLQIGSDSAGANSQVAKIFYADVRNGIDGTIVNKFDPNDASSTQAATGSWPSSSPDAAIWTLHRSGTNLPADIASDLSVVSVAGLPTGGKANFRAIDGMAVYYLPAPASVNSSVVASVGLKGFQNTTTAGNYSSIIRTWNNLTTPSIVDSATTGTLSFADTSANVSVGATVDPSLTFQVAGEPAACGGVTPTAGTSTTGTSVALGQISQSTSSMATQRIIGITNATSGFVVYARTTGPMADGSGHSISSGLLVGRSSAQTYPALGTESFGVRAHWWPANQWADMGTANRADYLGPTIGPGTDSACVSFRAQAGPTTPAGAYSTQVIYTAVPTF